MQAYGPGPPHGERRHTFHIAEGAPTLSPTDGSMTPSRYIKSFEGAWHQQPPHASFGQPLANPLSSQATNQMASYMHHEHNPFEQSFDTTNDHHPAMARSASLNNVNMYQNMIDDYHHNAMAAHGKRPLSPGQVMRQDVEYEPKRPKHDVFQNGSSKQTSQSKIASNPSSFESVASTQLDSGEDASKSRSPRSTTSEDANELFQRKPSLDLDQANARLFAQAPPIVPPGLPLNYENMSQLNFGRLAQGYAQINSHHFQQQPKAIPPHSLTRAVTTPATFPQLHAPHPVRPEPLTSHLLHIHNLNEMQDQLHQSQAAKPVRAHPLPPPPTSSAAAPLQKPKKTGKRRVSVRRNEDDIALQADISGIDNPDDAKRAQFLERNRLAACRSRLKKKEWIKALEHSAEDMNQRNAELASANDALRSELDQVRTVLSKHTRCDCGAVQNLHSELCAQNLLRSTDVSPALSCAELPAAGTAAASVALARPIAPVADSEKPQQSLALPMPLPMFDDSAFDLLGDSGFSLPTSVLDTPNLARQSEFASTVV